MSARLSMRIQEIPAADWSVLRDKFLIDWPKNMLGYYTVDNFVRWKSYEPDIEHLNLYALDGDWSDGTFVAVVSFSWSISQ